MISDVAIKILLVISLTTNKNTPELPSVNSAKTHADHKVKPKKKFYHKHDKQTNMIQKRSSR